MLITIHKPTSKKAIALNIFARARSNLLIMIILTIANIALYFFGVDTIFLFSATIPLYVTVLGTLSGYVQIAYISIGITIAIIVTYILCWIFSKKHYGWMIVALVLFSLDIIAMVGLCIWLGDFSWILEALIRAWILYNLIVGVKYGYVLKNLTPEDELEYENESKNLSNNLVNGEINATTNDETNVYNYTVKEDSIALRMADNDVKHRVLLMGHFCGRDICYRRVKRVNELVIDNYVYDQIEMLLENCHQLNAIVDGHSVAVGFDGIHSYIIIDGQMVAKKIRLM